MTFISKTLTKSSELNNNLNLDLDPSYLINQETPAQPAREITETENSELYSFIKKVNLYQQRETFKRILLFSIFFISSVIFSSLFFYFENQTRQQNIFIPPTIISASQVNQS